jgi:hypothetical protein
MNKKTYSLHNAYGPDTIVPFDEELGRRRQDEALSALRQMVHRFSNFEQPVLRLAPPLNTLWLEDAAFEPLLYARIDPAAALGTHEFFFRFQREDGLLPCMLGSSTTDKTSPAYGRFGMIQQNVPLARTSWELAKLTRNEAFLAKAYEACTRFDDWVRRYRNTRGTGLVEMFCMFDLGQDNSPRCTGIGMPGGCPDGNAAICPPGPNLPVLAPDMSAVVYGARCALADMAEALDKPTEARQWRERAAELRSLIVKYCQDPEDGFFYDVSPKNRFLRFRGTQLFPIVQEHVLTQEEFEPVWHRYLRNPHEFWTPYPFTSFSVSDPNFDRKLLPNSWGGPANCNLALRSLLWMEHYGKTAELRVVMERWLHIFLRYGFYWQVNPWTGDPSVAIPDIAFFTGGDSMVNNTVCWLAYLEFASRLELLPYRIEETHP